MILCIKQKYTGRVRVWMISGFCGYGDSVGIPTGFPVGMGWVLALTFNPHGSPGNWTIKGKNRDKIKTSACINYTRDNKYKHKSAFYHIITNKDVSLCVSQKMPQVWLAIRLTHIHHFFYNFGTCHQRRFKNRCRCNFLKYLAFTYLIIFLKWNDGNDAFATSLFTDTR